MCGEAVAGSLDGKHRECGWELIVAPKGWSAQVESERAMARATARILAHAYQHDNRPPDFAVDAAMAYPVQEPRSPAVVVDVDEVLYALGETRSHGGTSLPCEELVPSDLEDALTSVADRQMFKRQRGGEP